MMLPTPRQVKKIAEAAVDGYRHHFSLEISLKPDVPRGPDVDVDSAAVRVRSEGYPLALEITNPRDFANGVKKWGCFGQIERSGWFGRVKRRDVIALSASTDPPDLLTTQIRPLDTIRGRVLIPLAQPQAVFEIYRYDGLKFFLRPIRGRQHVFQFTRSDLSWPASSGGA